MVPLKTPEIDGLPEGGRGRPPPEDTLPSARRHANRTGEGLRALRRRRASTAPRRSGRRSKTTATTTTPPKRKYLAIRVMQIDSNNRLKQRVLAGELDQNVGRGLEQACLRALAAYDRDECSVDEPLEALGGLRRVSRRARPSGRVLANARRSALALLPVRDLRARSGSRSSSSAAPSETSAAASTTCSSSTNSYTRNSLAA